MVQRVQRYATDRSEMFACLEHPRRRAVVEFLAEESAPVDLERATEYVARRERNKPANTIDEEVLREVAISLHHIHLPMMDAADVVAFDPEANAVREGDQFDSATTHVR